MHRRQFYIALLIAAAFIGFNLPTGARAHGTAHEKLVGTWAINFIVPVSPKGNDFNLPHRHKFDFSDKDDEHTVVAREILSIRVPGAWRIVGEQFSATFELTCLEGTTCGSIVMRGSFDSDTTMSGRCVLFWDTPDSTTPTGYDTVSGRFTGEKCGIRLAHDTGGCDTP